MFSEEGMQKALLMPVNPQTKEMDGKKYVIWNMGDPSDSTLRETAIKFLGAYAKDNGCSLFHGIPW